MILIVDLCYRKDSLSRDEFVRPMEKIIGLTGAPFSVRHYSALGGRDLEQADGVVLCGTALKDDRFADDLEQFRWLLEFCRPVLGVCAGMQVMAAVFGGSIEPGCEIGMTDIRVVNPDPLFAGRDAFPAFELHGNTIRAPDEFSILAVSDRGVQAIRHRSRPIYGVMFHPEVRNEWIVEGFIRQAPGSGTS
jgi:GMP synthase-like glutamine amidotransferase